MCQSAVQWPTEKRIKVKCHVLLSKFCQNLSIHLHSHFHFSFEFKYSFQQNKWKVPAKWKHNFKTHRLVWTIFYEKRLISTWELARLRCAVTNNTTIACQICVENDDDWQSTRHLDMFTIHCRIAIAKWRQNNKQQRDNVTNDDTFSQRQRKIIQTSESFKFQMTVEFSLQSLRHYSIQLSTIWS